MQANGGKEKEEKKFRAVFHGLFFLRLSPSSSSAGNSQAINKSYPGSMKPRQLQRFSSKTLLFLYFFISFSHGDNQTLVSIIKDRAFKDMDLQSIGVEYKVQLPANLTGVEASALRMKSSTFLIEGANLSFFHFPPGIVSIPNRTGLLLVSYNIGRNHSGSLYRGDTAGYSLDSPVVGFVVYDAWNSSSRDLGLEQTGEHIKIEFPGLYKGSARLLCARFGEAGELSLEGEEMNGTCTAKGPGRFGVVVDDATEAPAALERSNWRVWVAVGLGGLVLALGAGIWVGVLVRRRRRMRQMVKEAEEGEALDVVWVGWSKMPSAGLMRTQPIMEK
ncbi:hypothetical protein KSP39_PZI005813 [Platanthera zijinensis]|uniref:Uncharacterized protein n=1 Tax=Platanthera zijinensis TaxID=2320716 RepID=A0AAP0BSS8_9ASPA